MAINSGFMLLELGEQGAANNAASVEAQSVLMLSALVARRAGVLHNTVLNHCGTGWTLMEHFTAAMDAPSD